MQGKRHQQRARVAVVSTPRSGNMWLRRLLVGALGAEERSAHTPGEVDWDGLPERVVLQLHWHRSRAFRAQLRRHGFEVVVLARHPLDVLVSILHFAPHEPQTNRWLDGEAGGEQLLAGAAPLDPAFLAYGLSPRARALLSVTPEWWERRGTAASVRYEELVAQPAVELERILARLSAEPLRPAADAVRAASFGRLRAEAANLHFWRGEPGHWRRLLTPDVAGPLAAAHAPLLARLGYDAGPAGLPTAAAAAELWASLARPLAPAALSGDSSARVTPRLHASATIQPGPRWKGRKRMDGSGLVVWLTGLPGAGKTTLALLLERRLKEAGVPASVVDGDDARHAISRDLGYSRADRSLNAERLAWVAAKVAGAGAVAIVASVSPYEEDRRRARALAEADGLRFREVHVDAPLDECRRRDPKGLYARAGRGEVTGLTGLDDPYEHPQLPDVHVQTAGTPPEACIDAILTAIWPPAGSQQAALAPAG